MEKLISHIIDTLCSEKGYSALFKAAVVLIGAALLAVSQAGTFLYEKDLAAHKAKYALEASIKLPLEEIDCSKAGAVQVDCMVAKHEMQTLDSTLWLLALIIQSSFVFGIALAVFSIFGFVCSLFMTPRPNGTQT
jgi:hypothetical protein